ncbi:MAG: PAS domain-containing protein [Pedobacter sp.]|nr:MAG: PAS domain-containing protein [Pedobacter sp.]
MLSPEQINQYSSGDFLYDHFPSGLLSFQPDGKIMAINQTMAKWSGKPVSELIGTDFKKLLAHPSLLYYDLFISPQLNMQGLANEFSLQFRCQEQTYDALFNAKTHFDGNGRPLIIIASIQKIASRKKYEAELLLETRNAEQQAKLAEAEKRRFEFLFSSFPNNVWTIGNTGQITNMNSRAAELFGSIKNSRLGLFAAVANQDRSRSISLWRKCQQDGRKFEKEMRIEEISGKSQWHLVTAAPFYGDNGQLEMWFCSTTNIHHQKLLQLANQNELKTHLSSAYRNLDQKDGLLLEIASDQSHMVRKPVANILGLTELMVLNPNAVDPHILDLLSRSAAELDQMIRKIITKTAIK